MIREPLRIISAKDIEQSLQFYQNALGFDLAYRWPREGPLEYAFLRSGEIDVWIVTEGMVERLSQTSWWRRDPIKLELDMEVEDVDATVEHLLQKGVNPLATGSIQQPLMHLTAVFEDPDGNLIRVKAKRTGK